MPLTPTTAPCPSPLPLPPAPHRSCRYRLQLREADDAFFRQNMLDAFVPQAYTFAGVAAQGAGEGGPADAATAVAADAEATGSKAASGAQVPLENETWWRLYESAAFMRKQLDKGVGAM